MKIIIKHSFKKYENIWTRADGSTITDPYEIVDDKQLHKCSKCVNMKPVAEYKIVGKYNPKLLKTCNECLEAQEIEKEQKRNGTLPRLEWSWNEMRENRVWECDICLSSRSFNNFQWSLKIVLKSCPQKN